MQTEPIFKGASTLEMSRLVYGIADPEDDQTSLLDYYSELYVSHIYAIWIIDKSFLDKLTLLTHKEL